MVQAKDKECTMLEQELKWIKITNPGLVGSFKDSKNLSKKLDTLNKLKRKKR